MNLSQTEVDFTALTHYTVKKTGKEHDTMKLSGNYFFSFTSGFCRLFVMPIDGVVHR